MKKTDTINDVHGCEPQFGFQSLRARNPIAVVLEIFGEIIKMKHLFQNLEKNEHPFPKTYFLI